MRFSCLPFALATACALNASAQWQMQDAHTTADLRGIDSLGGGVAWASGTKGTVLRTEDAGFVWQLCAVPPGADKLDFRGVQAFDNNTAIVMSSGPGDLSRLYKTTDGCQTWTLLFTNPDQDGFWDALLLKRSDQRGWLLGDPVHGEFTLWTTSDSGSHWLRDESTTLAAQAKDGAFAASNSSLVVDDRGRVLFGTGGAAHARIYAEGAAAGVFEPAVTPLAAGSAGAGVFSIAAGEGHLVAVGGDYTKPGEQRGTSAFSLDHGKTWSAAIAGPHGYRSSVAYDAGHKTWIAVGPNGTDISIDGGCIWRPLKPGPGDPPEADQSWNALSLPFVVGPHGRIATLRPGALQ